MLHFNIQPLEEKWAPISKWVPSGLEQLNQEGQYVSLNFSYSHSEGDEPFPCSIREALIGYKARSHSLP